MVHRVYVRLSRNAACELRVYVDAEDAAWWQENKQAILRTVRPLIAPRLRDTKSKNRTRDVVAGDGFQASIFLVTTATPHAILHRQKKLIFREHGEDEEAELKPDLRVHYRGFQIHARAIAVILKRDNTRSEEKAAHLEDWIQMSQQIDQQPVPDV